MEYKKIKENYKLNCNSPFNVLYKLAYADFEYRTDYIYNKNEIILLNEKPLENLNLLKGLKIKGISQSIYMSIKDKAKNKARKQNFHEFTAQNKEIRDKLYKSVFNTYDLCLELTAQFDIDELIKLSQEWLEEKKDASAKDLNQIRDQTVIMRQLNLINTLGSDTNVFIARAKGEIVGVICWDCVNTYIYFNYLKTDFRFKHLGDYLWWKVLSLYPDNFLDVDGACFVTTNIYSYKARYLNPEPLWDIYFT